MYIIKYEIDQNIMKAQINKLKGFTIMAIFVTIPLIACEETQDNQDNEATQETITDQNLINGIDLIQQLRSIPKEELSQAEYDGLVFLREEEKLARDVYITLNQTIPLRPFRNISQSEQQHMDAIKYLLDRYEIEDPANENEIGTFKNSELQDLFNTLIETGKAGKIEALKVGALIEEKDIFDLDNELNISVDNADIKIVYNNLVRASKNHLRAFTNVLSGYGIEYTPQILDPLYFNEITGRQ
jgi:hypothetical protein